MSTTYLRTAYFAIFHYPNDVWSLNVGTSTREEEHSASIEEGH